jgi:hypothetical protein
LYEIEVKVKVEATADLIEQLTVYCLGLCEEGWCKTGVKKQGDFSTAKIYTPTPIELRYLKQCGKVCKSFRTKENQTSSIMSP